MMSANLIFFGPTTFVLPARFIFSWFDLCGANWSKQISEKRILSLLRLLPYLLLTRIFCCARPWLGKNEKRCSDNNIDRSNCAAAWISCWAHVSVNIFARRVPMCLKCSKKCAVNYTKNLERKLFYWRSPASWLVNSRKKCPPFSRAPFAWTEM